MSDNIEKVAVNGNENKPYCPIRGICKCSTECAWYVKELNGGRCAVNVIATAITDFSEEWYNG